MAVDGHGRERHKKQWEQNEMYTNHAEHYLRQLASSYNVSVILFEFISLQMTS